MKLPSLFKTPRPQQFNITPRYYDPIKEDIEERTARIKSELNLEKNSDYRSNISGAFNRREKQNRQTSVLQLVLITVFLVIGFGYIYYGNDIFYFILLMVPIYFYFRIKKFKF